MHKILAITDIHMRSGGRSIIGLSPLDQFRKALSHALATHPDAEHVVLMGDLTNSGHPEEFEMVKDAIADYPIPVTFMLGNHDRRDNFTTIFPDTPMTPTGHLQTRIDLGDDVLLCLDTLDGPPYPKYHHSGMLCADRLQWLRDQLSTCADKRVSLFMHHPPHDCHQMPMALVSNDPSLSVAEPAAYGIILFNNDSIIAHSEDFEIAQVASAPSADAMPD